MSCDGRWPRRHQTALDVAIAALFALADTGATLAGASWWPAHPGPLAWVMLGVQAAACLSLIVRRRAPLLVMAILGACTLAVTLLISPAGALTPEHSGNVWAPMATVLAAYGPLLYDGPRRHRRWPAYVALAIFTAIVARVWQPSVAIISIGLARTAVGPLLALYFTARRRLVQALTERAERAERERHLLADRARAEERARLAGEMHDVVTHRVSLMVLQAGALRMTAPDEATRQAAEQLRAAGCQALDELRDLVGILRTAPSGDEAPTTPGLATLVAESVQVGTPAELIEEGDAAVASPVVGRTIYRLVREALTNVRKHAPGARVTVRVRYDETHISLAVQNTPPPGGPGGPGGPAGVLAGTGSGLGLVGLAQRVEVMRGTMHAGPTPDGGFILEVRLAAYVPTATPAEATAAVEATV